MDRGYTLCFWLDSILFLILIKCNFQNFHHQPRWNLWENRFQRKQKQFSSESSCKSHLVCEPLGDPLGVLGKCPALSSRASSDCCCCLATEPRHCLKGGWHRVTALPQGPDLTAERGNEKRITLEHSSIILHRKYQAQLFPQPSRATVVQRSHWTLNVWSSLLCSEHSRKEVSRLKLLLFSLCFSSRELVFPACRFMMYFNHTKDHSCFLPSLSAPSKPLPINGSTDSQTDLDQFTNK